MIVFIINMNLKFEDYLMIKHVYYSIVKMFKEKIKGMKQREWTMWFTVGSL